MLADVAMAQLTRARAGSQWAHIAQTWTFCSVGLADGQMGSTGGHWLEKADLQTSRLPCDF